MDVQLVRARASDRRFQSGRPSRWSCVAGRRTRCAVRSPGYDFNFRLRARRQKLQGWHCLIPRNGFGPFRSGVLGQARSSDAFRPRTMCSSSAVMWVVTAWG
jgi:hypothetical protein